MIDMWVVLTVEGCNASLPPHPLLLLLGHYERLHANNQSFRIQRHISQELDKHLATDLQHFSNSDPSLAARTLSNQNSGATAWLRTLPVKQSYRLAPAEFQQGVRVFAGLPPAGLPSGTKCFCGMSLSLSHALSCRCLRGRIARHDALVEDVHQWLRRRRIQVAKELTGVVPLTAHRVDLWVRCDGVVHWCDVTVADPACPSYLASSASQPGFAAKRAEGLKRAKWDKLVPPGVVVQPLAFESTGHVGPSINKFLRAMEKMSSSGPRRAELMAQLSISCIRFAVEMVREAGAKALLPRG
jgi:hypothetical protein